ncbi:unnamed protein product [Polarella glacialis]|uniref:BD-FAE-like domain-containing protein n=2 Tax=Polarella glacialis TaxID=89957 RepID=A0A813F5N4_POLGL|nr:unnamed protein product [Polarella glacialis]
MARFAPAWEEQRRPGEAVGPTLLGGGLRQGVMRGQESLKKAWTGFCHGNTSLGQTSFRPPGVLSRLLPRPVANTLLRKPQERFFEEEIGGEVHTYCQEHQLRLHLLRPPQDQGPLGGSLPPKRGCVILLHGGSWVFGSPAQFYEHALVVAQDMGVAVASCDYRLMLTHPRSNVPFDSVSDAGRCVRYLRDHADELGLDPKRLVLGGLSAGGHLAAMTALEGSDLDLAGLVLLNPVLDLHFAAGWQEQKQTPLVWFGSRFLRARYGAEALEAKSPMHQVRSLPYPTLILHGEDDKLIPLAQSEAFEEKMQRSGNVCTLISFPEVGHHFLRALPNRVASHLQTLETFLSSVGMMQQFPEPL